MELKIFWTNFAKSELRKIFDYYRQNVSLTVAQSITENIVRYSLKLKSHPKLGAKEVLLENRKEEFRFLVYQNYKIIYWVNNDENRIEINDVFDTQQNPIKIKRN